jgi:histidinol phosphatase-like PHP family hydrolase
MSLLKAVSAATLALAAIFAPVAAHSADSYAIKVLAGSEINMVAKDSRLPLKIQNDYQTAADVLVHVVPSNERLVVPESTLVSVPGFSTYTAKVPVKAISSGDVEISVWLTNTAGVKLTEPVLIEMHINSEIESIIIYGFIGFVVVLLIAGVSRTLRKRKLAE